MAHSTSAQYIISSVSEFKSMALARPESHALPCIPWPEGISISQALPASQTLAMAVSNKPLPLYRHQLTGMKKPLSCQPHLSTVR